MASLVVILAAAKVGSEIFERLKQPSVLGELVFGVILGNVILIAPNWTFFEALRVQPITEHWAIVIDSLARIGVILLLFEVGLESNIRDMAKVGISSLLVATAGVIVPFILGYGVSSLFIKDVPTEILKMSPNFDISNIHMFIGATLCATSVGITARIFQDLGRLQMKEARIILGAAVIDDVLGLIILAIVSGIVIAAETGAALAVGSLVKITVIAVGFLVVAITLGVMLMPRLMGVFARMRTHGIMLISSLLFCFVLSIIANLVGLATIVGAFAAGLILDEVHFKEFNQNKTLANLLKPITTVFVPIFFVLMGIQVRLETFVRLDVLGVAVGLIMAAVIGKQVCGLVVVERGLDRLSIGLGMIPRGEVGLIFASIGRGMGVINDAIFSAVVIMVMVTTLVTPPLLAVSLGRRTNKPR
jgi:Kef-type K+ transport system membrane component KefB